MIVILSSAKTLNLERQDFDSKVSAPIFKKEAAIINSRLAELSKKQLTELMEISPKLTEQVIGFIENFKKPAVLKPSILLYSGVVYKQLKTAKYKIEDFEFADRTLRTISGLYGILRPMDTIAPYRLEMGADFMVKKGQGLSDFWQDKVTASLNRDIRKLKANCVLNLASKEYSQAVNPSELKAPFINIDFKEKSGSKLKTVGLLAKVARGKMANYIIEKRIENPELLKKYNLDGYSYKAELSDATNFIFVR